MFDREASIIDEYSQYLRYAIENYGWWIIFTIAAFYFSKPYLKVLSEKRSRVIANDPKRVEVLTKDMKRARVLQRINQAQQQMNQTA